MNIQTYCDRCKDTVWFELDITDVPDTTAGLFKRALIHDGHVLNCEIDTNGSVRSVKSQTILENPTIALSNGVARKFHDLNIDKGLPVQLDIYTSNPDLNKFFMQVISEIIRLISELDRTDRGYYDLYITNKLTIVKTHRYDINVGLNVRLKEENLPSLKGLILDMSDVEKNKLDLEIIIKNQDFVGILTHKDTKDPYFHAISSLCLSFGIPFYIDSLSTSSLKGLFNFIYAVLQSSNEF
ncbi:MAG: hypothetical protein GPJ54_17945 [Candidatus Heimdallarchaeota archaeon]|nr:hypothetical protein [Candidatus Heimdallarchaeota archaeon]